MRKELYHLHFEIPTRSSGASHDRLETIYYKSNDIRLSSKSEEMTHFGSLFSADRTEPASSKLLKILVFEYPALESARLIPKTFSPLCWSLSTTPTTLSLSPRILLVSSLEVQDYGTLTAQDVSTES
jgi:hypothetical protein